MKRICLIRNDNRIAITTILQNVDIDTIVRQYNEANANNEFDPHQVIASKEFNEDTLPKDRTYRNAWRIDDIANIYHDLDHAKEIHLKNLETTKTNHLNEYQQLYIMAAIEGADVVAEDIAKKIKAIHSIQDDLNNRNIKTIDELKNYFPDVLINAPDKEKTKASIAMSLEKKKNEVTAFENALKSKEAEFDGAITAIKGFMMLLPDIQKTLNQINEKLDGSLDKNK